MSDPSAEKSPTALLEDTSRVTEVILELESIRKSYGQGTPVVTEVLHGINLEIRGGSMTALIGPSGSGKSTLLNILGLLDRPTAGRVLLQGVDTSRLDDSGLTRFRGRTIGFVFQFHHLLPAFSALENVVMPAYSDRGRVTLAMRHRAHQLLEEVGLGDQAHKNVTQLSGGQQQRVAVARALMMSPPLLLADEPTGNLDTETADQVFSLFRRLHAEHGSAVLLVTHDPRLAQRADRIVELVDGQVVSDQPQKRP